MRRAEMMAEQMHQRKIRDKRKKPRPGQLKKRGIENVSPTIKKGIDYELPAPMHTARDIVVPPDGNPIPGTASKGSVMSTSRRSRLASAIVSQKEHAIKPEQLDLLGMAKQAFGAFPKAVIQKAENGSIQFKVEKMDRHVLGTLDPIYGKIAFFQDGKQLAESVLSTGASITDRLSDMADDWLNFMGHDEAFKKMLKKFNSKRESSFKVGDRVRVSHQGEVIVPEGRVSYVAERVEVMATKGKTSGMFPYEMITKLEAS